MREGSVGSSNMEGESIAPKDSIMYRELSAYTISFSRETGCFYLDVTEYHPGELEIELNDLEKMLEFARQHKR